MFRPVLTVPPAEQPVTVEQCKQHAVVDYNDDDALIDGYIQAATGLLDGFGGYLGRCIVTQGWQVEKPRFAPSFHLPVPDVSAVEVSCKLQSGEPFIVPADALVIEAVATGTNLRFKPGFVAPALQPETTVSVGFTAGFGAADSVPWPLKVAVMQIVAHLHDNRDGQGEPPMHMATPFRWTRI